jgi:hypothetical protein
MAVKKENKICISDDTICVCTNLVQEDRMPHNPIKLSGLYMYHQV